MGYFCFENITLDDYLSLFCFRDSNFHKFCISNGLYNLKEIFEFVDKNDFYIKNKYSRAEITGIINILKYVYLNKKIVCWHKLNKKCIKSSKKEDAEFLKFEILYAKYYELIRGFGFNSTEAFDVCGMLDYQDTIGNAIVRLYNYMVEKPDSYNTSDFSITLKKVELFANYYISFLKNISDSHSPSIDGEIESEGLLNEALSKTKCPNLVKSDTNK